MNTKLLLTVVFGFASLSVDLRADEPVLDITYRNDVAMDLVTQTPLLQDGAVFLGEGGAAFADFAENALLEVPADPRLTFQAGEPLWFEAWIDPARFGKGGPVLSKGMGGNYRILLDGKGHLAFGYYSQGGWRSVVAESPLATGQWQHVATLVLPGGNVLLFVNGEVVARAENLPPLQSQDRSPVFIRAVRKDDGKAAASWEGRLGSLKLSRGNPRNVDPSIALGAKAFEVTSPF